MRSLSLFLLSVLAAIAPLRACSVPVFRYALEHWAPDDFRAVVFHRGPLAEDRQAMVQEIADASPRANLALELVDLAGQPSPEQLALSQAEAPGTLPWLVVKVPRAVKSGATVWSGPLSEEAVEQLVDSPARREIVERLGAGESAVWVLIESGDRTRDAAAARLLEDRLTELANTLALPQLEASDIANGLVSVAQEDLRLQFSVLRLARDDAAEQAFVRMLLATERDLATAREPIAIPIFGRGRALYAFVGDGLQRETIDQAAKFLIGKCSCQVKELNPGADLLFTADWDALVKAHTISAPDLPTLAEIARSMPETVTFGGETKPKAAPVKRTKRVPDEVFFWVGVFGVLLAASGVVGMMRE